MKKSIICVLLVLLLAVGTPAAAASGLGNFASTDAYAEGQFRDVSSGAWYAESVKAAYNFGLMQGSSDGCFHPEGNITLAEALALASRIHQIYHGGDGKFQQGEPWYQVYVEYGLEQGLLDETEAASVNQPATRAAFARMLAASVPSSVLNQINDIADGSIPDVADDAEIYRLYRAGVLTGNDTAGTFGPETRIQRSAVAAIATRVVDPSLRRHFQLQSGTADQAIPQGSWTMREENAAQEMVIEGNAYRFGGWLVIRGDDGAAESMLFLETGTITLEGKELVMSGEQWVRSSILGEAREAVSSRMTPEEFAEEMADAAHSESSTGIVDQVQQYLETGTMPD